MPRLRIDMILELAFAAGCRYIGTHNTRDFRGCAQLGTEVITPRDFLATVTKNSHFMNALTVQFPESLHRSIKALAEKEGWSVDQFVASAAAEKMAAMMTLDYLWREAAQGQREDFERFLAAVPHRVPDETDRSPE